MAVNIYDTANQLEQELRQTKEFKELKVAYDTMKTNDSAFSLFKDFQSSDAIVTKADEWGRIDG